MTVSTYTWMSAPSNSTVTSFRKWAQGIADALVACGMVQTDDTGQIADISTLAVPSSGQSAGYRVYRFDDALQTSAPLFVKVEFGNGASLGYTAMWVTVGQSTDGAGNIGGALLSRTSMGSSGQTTTEYNSYASGDGSSLCLVMWVGNPYAPCTVIIERSRDANGAATDSGFLVAYGALNAGMVRVIGNGGIPSSSKCADRGVLAIVPGTINGAVRSLASSLSKDGVTAPVTPVALMAPGVPPWVSNVVVAVHPGDAGTTSVIQTATINGELRTYRAFPFFDTNGGIIGPSESYNSIGAWFRPAIAWAV